MRIQLSRRMKKWKKDEEDKNQGDPDLEKMMGHTRSRHVHFKRLTSITSTRV